MNLEEDGRARIVPVAKKRTVAELEQEVEKLKRENAELLDEQREALEFHAATSNVLKAISRSTFDVDPVLQTMVETAARLCQAASGVLFRRGDDGIFRFVAGYALDPAYIEHERHTPIEQGEGSIIGRTALAGRTVQILDAMTDPAYVQKEGARIMGVHSMLGVPLIREGEMVGAFGLARREVEPFSDRQVELVATFADQAVIAIENARLLAELREALERQTATSEILRSIASSPGEAEGTLRRIAETTQRLIGAAGVSLRIADTEDEEFKLFIGVGRGAEEVTQLYHGDSAERYKMRARTLPWTVILENRQIHIPDLDNLDPELSAWPGLPVTRAAGIRTTVGTPLRSQNGAIGAMVVLRDERKPFDENELKLLQSFADQAAIAIENARLLAELRESLDRQTASAEVLRTIASAPAEAERALNAIASVAARLFGASDVNIMRLEGGVLRHAATVGELASTVEAALPDRPLDPSSIPAIAILERRPFSVADLSAPDVRARFPAARLPEKPGSVAAAPLMREGEAIGAIVLVRHPVRPFTPVELAQVQNFADQAVIAIENARLLSELRESLDRRTAIAEVLQVISSSPGDVQPVFETMLDRAVKLCDPADGAAFRVENDILKTVAFTRERDGVPTYAAELPCAPGTAMAQMLQTKHSVHVPNLVSILNKLEPGTALHAALSKAIDDGAICRLWVPAVRHDEVVACFMIQRREMRPFSDAEIGLVENFASQAVIAIENARLLAELREARDAAERALVDLRAAQANLIQAEKMASLGQLTAGIAHEIKNPLNFVNNFAGLSVELLDELKEAQAAVVAVLDADKRAEIDEIASMLTSNLEKIAEHGQRADGIVKSMLAHSRGGSSERQEANLNALVEEALNLAYHGARAQDQSFNITLERDLDPELGLVEVVPQELTRVFLNLFGNGFYAANKRRQEEGDGSFSPTLKVTTREADGGVEVRIRDNGIGIPADLLPRLFEPFFTTKPTGEGTGLGLSISYEIVTRQHGGQITVKSEPGAFTEFTVTIPRSAAPGTGGREDRERKA